jgi:hypothetical protein
MRKLLLTVFCHLIWCLCFAQKTLTALKANQSPRIDGKLDEQAWINAPVATDFIQRFPSAGQPASLKTNVKILYNDDAVFIAAYLYDEPSKIRKQITARDEEEQADADYFSVFFDTYNDKQNGFQFLVTSMNVQTDARLGAGLGGDFNSFGDKTWDAVWDSKVTMKTDGWVVEIKIPYSSLRFSKKEVQDWGLQFLRFTRTKNETAFWNPVDPSLNGFVNQFGLWQGLREMQPPLRLSFSPYVSTGIRTEPKAEGSKTEWLRSGGMDVKYGLSESFTLDATIIPDFGQVISDNVVNNLSPYEVYFQENRPFFTEGTELFNKSGLFYSRRVGATPTNYHYIKELGRVDPDIEVRRNPTITQLYNAIKFSGRTKKKLGIGVFNSIAAPMDAIVRNRSTGFDTRIRTEPLSNYNIVVLDQALKGRSNLTFTNTNVMREGDERDANVSAFDFNLYDKANKFNIKGTGRYSRIMAQNDYDGFSSSLKMGKVSGTWQYTAQAMVESDKYDPTDLGFLLAPNVITYIGNVSYNQFKPTRNFLNYSYSLYFHHERIYNINAFSQYRAEASGFWIFKNFWDIKLVAGSYIKKQHDYFVMHTPGKFVRLPTFSFGELSGSTDSRKKLFVNYDFLLGTFDVKNKNYHIVDLGLRYRFSNRLSLEVSNRHESETNYIVYAGREVNGNPKIGFVDFSDITSVFSGIYHFAPRVNLTLRARHYWSNVIYKRIANVDAKGNAINIIQGPFPSADQNINFFNLDAFFTWDFRLGSRLILGYKNWLGEDENISGLTHKSYLKNFGQLFNLRHGNELTARFIYYLDYNQMRSKK